MTICFSGATPAVQWQGPSQPDHADAVKQAYFAPKAIPVAPATSPDAWDDLLGDTPPGAPLAPPAATRPHRRLRRKRLPRRLPCLAAPPPPVLAAAAAAGQRRRRVPRRPTHRP